MNQITVICFCTWTPESVRSRNFSCIQRCHNSWLTLRSLCQELPSFIIARILGICIYIHVYKGVCVSNEIKNLDMFVQFCIHVFV